MTTKPKMPDYAGTSFTNVIYIKSIALASSKISELCLFSAHSNKIGDRQDFYLCRVNKKSYEKNDLLLNPNKAL